ncbi:MAG: hypothetical protein MI861_12865 [Pirellulales bacterium]|nr:hypothetical protein [Pirellulales bacterium]
MNESTADPEITPADSEAAKFNIPKLFLQQATSKALPHTKMGWLLDGLVSPLRGLTLLRHSWQKLTFYLVAPIAIQTVISTSIIALLFLVGSLINTSLHWLMDLGLATLTDQTANTDSKVYLIADWTLTLMVWATGFVAFFFIFHLVWRVTGGIVCGYFSGKLTDAVMKERGFPMAAENTSFPGELASGFLHQGILVLLGGMTSVLAAIPFIGIFIGAPINLLTLCFTTGIDELSDPLKNMGMGRLEIWRFCLRHRMATLGLGTARACTEPIPLIGGVARAAEALGRITLAVRLVEHEKGMSQAPTTVR